MKVYIFYAKISTRFKKQDGTPEDQKMRKSIDEKVKYIGLLITAAYAIFRKTRDQGDVFVFIAPEYFFVKYTEEGPKKMDGFFLSAEEKAKLLADLSALCTPKFDNDPNVLVIFGTMGHYVESTSLQEGEIQAIKNRCEQININVGGGNGDTDTSRQRETLLKYYTSAKGDGKRFLDRLGDQEKRAGLFVVRNTAVIFCNQMLQTYDKRYEAMSEESVTLELPCYTGWENWMFAPGINLPWTVTLNNRKFGVEICAEFEYGNLHYDGNNGDGITDLDFQLITAEEVSIGDPFKFACKDTGFVVNCDSRENSYLNRDSKGPGDTISRDPIEILPNVVAITPSLYSVVFTME